MRHKYDPQDLPAMVPVHHRRMWNSLDAGIYCIRLAVLESQDHQETRRFVSLYGQPHLNSVVQWFKKAGEELL